MMREGAETVSTMHNILRRSDDPEPEPSAAFVAWAEAHQDDPAGDALDAAYAAHERQDREAAFRVGDLVIWRHEMRGGYGYVERIPGKVVRVTPKRVIIRVERQRGTYTSEMVERSVKPEYVERRGAAQ